MIKVTPLSNTPTSRRFFGGILMGGSSVGRVIKFLGGVQRNWAGQCEIVGGVGSLLIPAGGLAGAVSPPAGPEQSPGGGAGRKAPGISHFLVAENGLKYSWFKIFISDFHF